MEQRIIARFRPQAWINDNAVDIDGQLEFDVTEQVEKMGREKALEIEDCDYGADALWHAHVQEHPELEHNGPFEVEVAESIRRYYGIED